MGERKDVNVEVFNMIARINDFKTMLKHIACDIRAEKIWCMFVSCTKYAPNIDWRGMKYCAPTLFFMVINIFYSFITSLWP